MVVKKVETTLRSQTANMFEIGCSIYLINTFGSYLWYDNSVQMNHFYYITDRSDLLLVFLVCFSMLKGGMKKLAGLCVLVTIVRLSYSIGNAAELIPLISSKFSFYALLILTVIVFLWNIKSR